MAVEYKLSYTASEIDERLGRVDTNTTDISKLDTKINNHNVAQDSHNDIRTLITNITDRLNALADSDDTTLDQLSELVAYIKDNRELIEVVTTDKANVSDIVDDLITNVANKPLSAAQGVAIKGLIDALQTEVAKKAEKEHVHSISDVTNLQTKLDEKANADHTHVGQEDFSESEPTEQVTGDYWMLSY